MVDKLSEVLASMRRNRADPVAMDASAIEKLRGLGYLGGTKIAENADQQGQLRDPKDMLPVYRSFLVEERRRTSIVRWSGSTAGPIRS